MADSENRDFLSSDKPVTNPDNDRLGYAPFARHLAKSILKMAPPEGLVMAIYGPWGSGKSSVLEFIIHYLEIHDYEDAKPIVIRFNPWWFSGQEALTLHFLAQLSNVLASKMDEVKDQLSKRIAILGKIVSKTPVPGAKLGELVEEWFSPEFDVVKQKQEIGSILARQGRRTLIVIDDIDRLTTDEIRQLFLLIKAVADFPNVIYLLAFDKQVVAKALEDAQGSGEKYIEKIIQVPFELPLPDHISLYNLLSTGLDSILIKAPSSLWNEQHWAGVYTKGIRHFVSTPRDVVRLLNTLKVTYPAVDGEVNIADFIAMESIRVFHPSVYDHVRKNRDQFAGAIGPYADSARATDRLREFHKRWMSEVGISVDSTIIKLLGHLFPKLENLEHYGSVVHGSDWTSRWRKQLRICSPDVFDIYFRLAVPDGSLTNAAVSNILALADDTSRFGDELKYLATQKRSDGISQLRLFLDRLEDYTDEDFPSEQVPTIINAFFKVGDELLLTEESLPFDIFTFDRRIGRILWQLLRRFNEAERYRLLREGIEQAQALSVVINEVVAIGRQHNKYGDSPAEVGIPHIVNEDHFSELEKIAIKKVETSVAEQCLLSTPQLPRVLAFWKHHVPPKTVRDWVGNTIEELIGLAEFLERFLGKSFRQSITDTLPETIYRLDPLWIEPYVRPDQVYDFLSDLGWEIGDLSEAQQLAIHQFRVEYEMRRDGNDPNDVI